MGALLLVAVAGCETSPDDLEPALDDRGELTCAESPVCPRAELGATANDGGTNYNEDVVCVLEALRDFAPGALVELEVGRDLLGDSPQSETIVVRADGSALHQTIIRRNGEEDEVEELEECVLELSSYFSDCLDSPSSDCLDTANWLTDCQPNSDATCE